MAMIPFDPAKTPASAIPPEVPVLIPVSQQVAYAVSKECLSIGVDPCVAIPAKLLRPLRQISNYQAASCVHPN